MQTVQTPHVLAVRTGLTTEARSVGGHLLREVVVTKDDISEDVGDRDLGCRDEIEVIKLHSTSGPPCQAAGRYRNRKRR